MDGPNGDWPALKVRMLIVLDTMSMVAYRRKKLDGLCNRRAVLPASRLAAYLA